MGEFSGKVALVTGGASGIGRAGVVAFAAAGAAVGVLDVDEEGIAETVALVEGGGGRALGISVDVGREESVKKAVATVIENFGGLDFAFNNAGIQGRSKSLTEMPLEEWERVVRVNMTGVFLCMKHELPEIIRRGGGAIVNMSSAAGLYGLPAHPVYVPSKHGVVGLTKAAAIDYGPQGVRINAICPAGTITPMYEAVAAGTDFAARGAAASPLGRLAEPEEMAAAAVWLCSKGSSYVNGVAMSIDGGTRA